MSLKGVAGGLANTGLAVVSGIGMSAMGAAILNGGWHFSSIGLTMGNIVQASAVGSAVFMPPIVGIISCCLIGKMIPYCSMPLEEIIGGSFTAGGTLQIAVLPAGAAMLSYSGVATYYCFAAGAIGATITYCIAKGVSTCCVEDMNNVNILQIPEKISDENLYNVVKISDLEENSVVNMPEEDLSVVEEKRMYLVQAQNLCKNGFDDIRGKDMSVDMKKVPSKSSNISIT